MRPIILDTDPGIDDAVAFVVLHHYAADAVKLIVTGYGNVRREDTVNNALTMCALLNWDVPVLAASEKALSGTYEPATHIHGSNGLGGLTADHGDRKPLASADWVETLYQTILKEETVDYITLGTLTNLTMLLQRHPDAKAHIGKVVMMGGGIDMGNVRPYAEFNIFCDPESAAFILQEMPDTALVPLNTTETVAFKPEQINAIDTTASPLAQAMHTILMAAYESCVRFGEYGATMHDSTAVLYYLFPELFTGKRCGIDVNTTDKPGCTTINETRQNVFLTETTDAPLLLQKIMACITE